MNATEFRSEALGQWSSHPAFHRSRLHRWRMLASIPLLALLIWLTGALLDLQNMSAPIKFIQGWTAWAFQGLVFFLAMSMTAALIAALGLRGAGEQASSGLRWMFGHPVRLLVLVTGLAPSLYAVSVSSVPTPVKLVCHGLALLPLLLLLNWLSWTGREPVRFFDARRIFKIVWICGLLALMGVARDLAALLRGFVSAIGLDIWFPGAADWIGGAVGLLALIPLVSLVSMVTELWVAALVAPRENAEGDAERPTASPSPPILQRVLDRLRRRAPPAPPSPTATRTGPAWAQRLLDDHAADWGQPVIEPFSAGPAAGPSGRRDLVDLFGGHEPTEDQARCFERFILSYAASVAAARERGVETPSADLLVEGPSGSGRSTVLAACAAFAAFTRGQRVLMLVPDELQVHATLQRLRRVFRSSEIGLFVRCESLTAESVASWLEPEGSLPHVIVATPAAVETCLYGTKHGQHTPHFDRVRKLVLLLDLVLVDDMLSLDAVGRSHLACLLDKHRLLLASEHLPMQRVLVCPLLADVAHDRVFVPRMFGASLDRERLDPLMLLPTARAWTVTIPGQGSVEELGTIASQTAARKKRSLVICEPLDPATAHRLRKTLAGGVDGEADAPILAPDLNVLRNEMETDRNARRFDVIVLDGGRSEERLRWLQLTFGHEDTVFFLVGRAGADVLIDEPEQRIVPVVADRSAEPYLVTHLQSVLRFLRVRNPIPLDACALLGIRPRDLEQRPRANFTPQGRIHLDDRPPGEDGEPPATGFASVRALPAVGEAIDLTEVPSARLCLALSPGGDELWLGEALPDPREQRPAHTARWVDGETHEMIGRMDLARMPELVLNRGGRTFVPGRLRIDENVIIPAKLATAPDDAHSIPICTMRWTVDPSARASELGGGESVGVMWCRLTGASGASDQVRFDGQLTALAADKVSVAQRVDPPIPVVFAGGLSVMMLGFERCDAASVVQEVPAALAGPWGHGPERKFCHALTVALNYACEQRAPGISLFGRILAFEVGGSGPLSKTTAAFLIETPSSGRTAFNVLSSLLEHSTERAALFRYAKRCVNQLRASSRPEALALRLLRVGFPGAITRTDMDASAVTVDAALARPIW